MFGDDADKDEGKPGFEEAVGQRQVVGGVGVPFEDLYIT